MPQSRNGHSCREFRGRCRRSARKARRTDGSDTDTFFSDECDLRSVDVASTGIYIVARDTPQTAPFGRLFIDDIRFDDASGTQLDATLDSQGSVLACLPSPPPVVPLSPGDRIRYHDVL